MTQRRARLVVVLIAWSAGWASELAHDWLSTLSTANTFTRPDSMKCAIASIMWKSSYSKNLPPCAGNTSTGLPK